MAIRRYRGNVYQMRKTIRSIVLHYSKAESPDRRHVLCPTGADSWCKFQTDKITGQATYKERFSLEPEVSELLKPIFDDLSSDTLLEKCQHGKTQNANESINQVIWQRCPKDVFVGRTALEIGVASAVLSFNDGHQSLVNVFEKLGMEAGTFMKRYCFSTDTSRVKKMNKQCSTGAQKRRKKLRAIKKGFCDADTEAEGITYETGAF